MTQFGEHSQTFWQAFGLVILILFSISFLLRLNYMDILIHWSFELYNFFVSQNPLSPLSRDSLYNIDRVLDFVIMAILEVLHMLLTVSLAFLGLHILRNQSAKTSMVFSFFQAWRPLVLLGVMFYLLNLVIHSGTYYLFKDISLFNDNSIILNQIFPMVSGVWRTSLFVLLYTYFITVFFMASLLILDRKIGCKSGLCLAFKAIQAHLIKCPIFIVFILLVGLGYMSAGADTANLNFFAGAFFLNLQFFYFFLFYFIPGVFMAISLILYNEIANKTGQHLIRKLALIASFGMLLFAILAFSAKCEDLSIFVEEKEPFLFALFVSGFIATLMILYKTIAIKKIQYLIKNITLAALLMMLSLVITVLFFTGVGLIWLLPMISLSIAIQYQYIFSDKSLSYV